MELDPKTLIKIAETHTHVTHILESLENGNETFKDHDERLRKLEQQQQFMNGKLEGEFSHESLDGSRPRLSKAGLINC